ncbi:MAG: hypothetical protein ACRCYO_02225, partial [Bacteroidia bacterium]
MKIRTLFFLTLLLFFSSCFHKDVLNDRADNVAQSLIYTGAEGTFIITREEVFQATNKRSSGGFTSVSGYAEYRLSTYNAETGKLVARIELGEGLEKTTHVLGTTAGKIWLYNNTEQGLHCRNPQTLELIDDQNKLTSEAPLKGFQFAKPSWTQINDFFVVNLKEKKLMLSDMQGYTYYFDPAAKTLVKTEDKIPKYTWARSNLSNIVYFNSDTSISLSSDLRSTLECNSQKNTSTLSFLRGQLVIDNNIERLIQVRTNALAVFKTEQEKWQDSLDLLTSKHPIFKQDNPPWQDYSREELDMRSYFGEIKRNYDRAAYNYDALSKEDLDSNYPLTNEPYTALIVHATDVSDTAHTILTKVDARQANFSQKWTLQLPQIYFDASKANSKGAFATVMSEGNPRFDYKWFDQHNNQLFMIVQLKLLCIDLK